MPHQPLRTSCDCTGRARRCFGGRPRRVPVLFTTSNRDSTDRLIRCVRTSRCVPQVINLNNFWQWISWFSQRWRTQRNAIRNANCKTQWIIKTLNANCAPKIRFWSMLLWVSLLIEYYDIFFCVIHSFWEYAILGCRYQRHFNIHMKSDQNVVVKSVRIQNRSIRTNKRYWQQ